VVLPQPAEAACAQKNIDVAVAASFDDVAHLFEPTNNDTLYLINFWATWCAPCVAELPFLEKVGDSYGGVPVKIVLMSLDFTKDSTKLCTFVSQNELRHPVVHLRDKKYNDWMPKVCESWEGAIPFSIALRGKKRLFHELEFEDTTAVELFFEPLLKS
jgi:thiol-disulfide isomerase/thioredoxin